MSGPVIYSQIPPGDPAPAAAAKEVGVADLHEALVELGFPTWSTTIHASHSEKRGPGAVNVPVVMGGVIVNPGDIVVADSDGVLAVPPEALAATLETAGKRRAKEAGNQAAARRGAQPL